MTSAELLLHPVRLRIAQAFLGERQLTTSQLRQELGGDVPAASLYRHVTRLVDGGVLAVVAERRVRGAVERTYAFRPEAAQVDPTGMSAEDHRQAFLAYVSGLVAQMERYLADPDADPIADGLGYSFVGLWLSDEEHEAFVRDLSAIVEPLMANRPEPGRRRRILGTALLPAELAVEGGPRAPRPQDG